MSVDKPRPGPQVLITNEDGMTVNTEVNQAVFTTVSGAELSSNPPQGLVISKG